MSTKADHIKSMLIHGDSSYYQEEDQYSLDDLLEYFQSLLGNACPKCEGQGDLRDDYGINTCNQCGGIGLKASVIQEKERNRWLAAVDRWMRDSIAGIVNDQKDPLIVTANINEELKALMTEGGAGDE